MRRRHGIPDNDHRPFNVAYAAATRARQELEAEARRSRRVSLEPQASAHTSSELFVTPTASTRQRHNQIQSQAAPYRPSSPAQVSNHPVNSYYSDGENISTFAGTPRTVPEQFSTRERSSRRSRLSTLPAYGKHALEEEEDAVVDHVKESKKSRVDGGNHIDGNEDAGWTGEAEKDDSGMEVDEDAYTAAGRGSKRSASMEGEDHLNHDRIGSKRMRKVSRNKSSEAGDQEMEDADSVHGLPSITRGKKRDRGEAGSVFGGDESVLDEEEGKPKRHTRRRTASHKKTSVSSRGQKRGRANSGDSEAEEDEKPMKRSMRQRRGQQSTDDSDLSMDDGMVSHDPLCKGRRIGEEWEVNGVVYKVGPNGQRLRQALVRRPRPRFPMPKDSEHPDRNANIDVFVETWLSDEQYQEAKERHELAWQESSPRQTAEPESPGDVSDVAPAKPGKNLLWSSTTKGSSPAAQRRPFRHSTVATVGLRVNPFEHSNGTTGRRISSVQSAPLLTPDSPKLHSSKSYSKWEKQDLEAVAMAKLREKAQKQIAATAEKPFISPPAPQTNGISDDKKETHAAPNNVFKLPAAPASTASTDSKPALASAGSTTSSFAKPAVPSEPVKPLSISFPPGPLATPSSETKPTTSSPVSNSSVTAGSSAPAPAPTNLFAPSTATAAGSSPTAPSSAPNFFAKSGAASAVGNTLTVPSPGAPVPSGFFAKSQVQPAVASASTTAPPSSSQPTSAAASAPLFSFKAPTTAPSQSTSTQQNMPTFGHGMQAQNGGSTPSTGFNILGAASKSDPTKQPESASVAAPPGESLFTRIGSFAVPTTSAPTAAPVTSSSTFSFGKQTAPANEAKPAVSSMASATPATGVKFNFFANPSTTTASGASPTPTPTPTTVTPSTGGAFGAASKFTGSCSSAPTTSSPLAAPPTTASTAPKPTFSFGNSTTPSTSSTPAAGPSFGVSSNGATGSAFGSASAFGANTAPVAATSPFGAISTPATNGSAFGTSSSSATSPFGAANSTNPALPFGTSPAAAASPFSFGITTTPASNKSAVGMTSTPAATSTSQPSQSGFGGFGSTGFGNGASTAFGSGSNIFGGQGTAAFAPKPAEENKGTLKFNFSAPPTSSTATSGAEGAAPANGTQPALSAFGFGNPSSTTTSTFSFGASSSQKQRRTSPGAFSWLYLFRVVSDTRHGMLSNNALATPRPRPPAKARRSPSLNFPSLPPPPPYAPRLEVLLDSPIGVTTQLLGTTGGEDTEESDVPPGAVEEWMNEKSKEELSDLLLKAGGLIKERETELGLTSALVKSLYHNNIALKTKHEALLSRLPANVTRTPSPPLVDVPACPSPLSQSPHYYTASLPHTPIDSPASRSPPLPPLGHHRRISVTPAEIALLADQNAELLDKLETLEEESERNDQIGRRKLKKLEQEIQWLKEELEETQAKEQEMAEKAKILNDAELQRKKEEREERLRNLKEQAASDSEDPFDDIRDFAPAPELPRSGSAKTFCAPLTTPAPPPVNMSTKPVPTDSSLLAASPFPHPPRSPAPRPEYALIAELLKKIQELEETNQQITREQRSTEDRYRAVQRDAESIRRAYDYLEDDSSDVRVLDTASSDLPPSGSAEETIKFSSIRRTIDGDINSFLEDGVDEEDFINGISLEMFSTTRENILPPPPGNKSASGHKSRKSVVGLFDSPESSKQSNLRAAYPPTLDVSPSFRSDNPTDLADMSTWSTAAVDSFDVGSPAMPSSLGLTLPPNSSRFGSISLGKQSLGSELGSEFGDDWGQNAGNYHLRSSSLYDLTHVTAASRANTPSPIAEQALVFHTPPGSPPPPSESAWEDLDESPDPAGTSVSGSMTPVRPKRMSLLIDPPTPSPRSNRNSLALREARSIRNLRLSETVRARTNRWVEGRYAGAESSALSVPMRRRRSMRAQVHGHTNRGSDASMIFSETFDVVVRQLSFRGEDDLAEEDEDVALGNPKAVSSPAATNANAIAMLPRRKEGFVGFILEVWLWLQFAVVVMVFLWAMARRGPKSVLKEAEKRKASGTVRR
ncbi:hypothetical protein BXZ70DRAFT_904066 [Cristinia sonorae]|uniref:Uncharacterized protein n=1 Tax=Cristinia sonorae TaxID=1940300 RepID=A0A8K0XTK2_9AGAR|nr:hypothetical protein BXZ70DRAFT_904066 [Cristinia sonorae]